MILISGPNSTTYYFPFIITYISVIFILLTLITYYKRKNKELSHKNDIEIQNTSQSTESKTIKFLGNESSNSRNINESDRKKKNSLRLKYLVGFLLTKGSVWAKSPFLFIIFVEIHGFSLNEIGILYVVDGISALIFGPILGNLADIFGRKLFCLIYCLLTSANLLMRCYGNITMAYLAQIMTGLGSCLINTSLESWINYESRKVFDSMTFEDEKQKNKSLTLFMKKLFKDQSIYDSISSLIISVFCSILYNYYGLFAPIFVAVSLVTVGFLVIYFFWDENNPNEDSKGNFVNSVTEACYELKKPEVLSIGLIESFFQAVFALFLFFWTPILTITANSDINIGMVFVCFVMNIIIFAMIYELMIINFKFDNFKILPVFFLVETVVLFSIYFFNNYAVRLILLLFMQGFGGFFNPLNSVIKSKLLIEKYRALLMNIFRIPLNFYVIIVLLFLRFFNAFQICLISAFMIIVPFIVSIILVKYHGNSIRIKD